METKELIKSLLWRNTIVGVVSVFMLSSLQLVSNIFLPDWLRWAVLLAFFCSLLWANGVLFKQQRPILAVLLSLSLVPILGFPASLSSAIVGRALADRRYRTEGFRLVDGCNGGAANQADSEVRSLRQLLAELADTPNADTNEIAHLKEILTRAQEKAQVLSDDCRWRGHRGNYPWKTNWSGIRRELEAAKKRLDH
jgi:hypothetical protein